MGRQLNALYVEFPTGKPTTYMLNITHPTEKDYVVKKIESARFGSTVRVHSENEKGDVLEQFFTNVPYVLNVEDFK